MQGLSIGSRPPAQGRLRGGCCQGDIGEALITTAAGIVAAVIAVVLYNYFQTRVARTLVELRLISDEFIEVIKEQRIVATAAGASPSSPPSSSGTTSSAA